MVDETGQPYAYTGDDPVNSTDPLGLCSTSGGTFLVSGACHFTSMSWVAQVEGGFQLQKTQTMEGGFAKFWGNIEDFGDTLTGNPLAYCGPGSSEEAALANVLDFGAGAAGGDPEVDVDNEAVIAGDADQATAQADAEADAAQRASVLQGQLPTGSQGRVTMASGVLEDPQGNYVPVIATSEPGGYLRPGVTVDPGEIVISGTVHAEQSILDWANANGFRVITVGVGRPICPSCAAAVQGSGASTATPLK
jgi:hypothetical protein